MKINNKMKNNLLLVCAAIVAFASCDIVEFSSGENQYGPDTPSEINLSNNLCLVNDSEGTAPESILVYDENNTPVIFQKDARVTVENVYQTNKWTARFPKFAASMPDLEQVTLADGKICVEVPSVQTVSAQNTVEEGLFASAGAVSMSEGNYHILFKDVFTYLDIEIDQPKVAAVEISSVAGATLSGKVGVDFTKLSADDLDFWTPDASGTQSSSTVIKPKDAEEFAIGVYRMAVLPQIIEKGLNVNFLDKDNKIVGTRVFAGKKILSLNGGKVTDIASKVLPDAFKIVVDFAASNPFGEFKPKAQQSAQPNSDPYTFKYFYEYDGDEFDFDFTFRLCKGAAATGYYQYDDVNHEYIIFSNQGGIQFPAISEKYLKSVTINYRNTSGSNITASIQEGFAYAAATAAKYLCAASFPQTTGDAIGTATYDLSANSKLKKNTAYCVRIGSPASKALRVTSIELEYSNQLN